MTASPKGAEAIGRGVDSFKGRPRQERDLVTNSLAAGWIRDGCRWAGRVGGDDRGRILVKIAIGRPHFKSFRTNHESLGRGNLADPEVRFLQPLLASGSGRAYAGESWPSAPGRGPSTGNHYADPKHSRMEERDRPWTNRSPVRARDVLRLVARGRGGSYDVRPASPRSPGRQATELASDPWLGLKMGIATYTSRSSSS